MKARIPNQNQGNMMQKIQKMQEDMARIQTQVEETEFTASAGGGAVEVTVTGKHEVKAVNIKPEVVDPEDVEMLQDMILAAVNGALKLADDKTSQSMAKLNGGLPSFPGMF